MMTPSLPLYCVGTFDALVVPLTLDASVLSSLLPSNLELIPQA